MSAASPSRHLAFLGRELSRRSAVTSLLIVAVVLAATIGSWAAAGAQPTGLCADNGSSVAITRPCSGPPGTRVTITISSYVGKKGTSFNTVVFRAPTTFNTATQIRVPVNPGARPLKAGKKVTVTVPAAICTDFHAGMYWNIWLFAGGTSLGIVGRFYPVCSGFKPGPKPTTKSKKKGKKPKPAPKPKPNPNPTSSPPAKKGKAQVAPRNINFGQVPDPGQKTKSFTIKNIGNAPFGVGPAQAGKPVLFKKTKDQCGGKKVDPNAACKVSYTFICKPAGPVVTTKVKINIYYDNKNSVAETVTLTGQCVAGPPPPATNTPVATSTPVPTATLPSTHPPTPTAVPTATATSVASTLNGITSVFSFNASTAQVGLLVAVSDTSLNGKIFGLELTGTTWIGATLNATQSEPGWTLEPRSNGVELLTTTNPLMGSSPFFLQLTPSGAASGVPNSQIITALDAHQNSLGIFSSTRG